MAGSRAWWGRRSLRARLTAAAVVVIALGMAAAGALLVWRLQSVLLTNLDGTLTQRVTSIAEDANYADVSAGNAPERAAGSLAVQVVGARGRVIASSPDIRGEPRLFHFPGGREEPAIRTVDDATLAAPYRVAALSAHGPAGPVTIYVGSPTTEVVTSVDELGGALIVGVPIVIVLLGLVGWWLLGRALRPVEALRGQAAAIPGTDLRRRLDTPGGGPELRRLTETFNELLGRIQAGTVAQRKFVADAAHELRSPLAALRARLEVDARGSGSGTADVLLPDVIRLSEMVDGLLALARLDAGAALQAQPVDLDDVVWDEARQYRGQAPPTLDTTGISPARVLGDEQALHRVVRNLVSNAHRHARSKVTLRLGSGDEGQVLLTVADDGEGIPAQQRERVFERFTRLDEARSRDAGGAGLGLAIVADVVGAHGGSVRIEDNEPGARVSVRLPALPTE